jgi:protein-tyrosine phosphatase
MGLDYSDGSVNFRDVGEFVNLIAGKDLMAERILLRGGKTDFVKEPEEILNPKTIVNLRKGHDIQTFGADYFHFPLDNKIEKYHTGQPDVKKWLNEIFKVFENENIKFPVFIHCLSGKDRTGIVVAILLKILGIPQEIILEEYLLSDGEVHKDLIETALDEIGDFERYFKRVDLNKIRKNFNCI